MPQPTNMGKIMNTNKVQNKATELHRLGDEHSQVLEDLSVYWKLVFSWPCWGQMPGQLLWFWGEAYPLLFSQLRASPLFWGGAFRWWSVINSVPETDDSVTVQYDHVWTLCWVCSLQSPVVLLPGGPLTPTSTHQTCFLPFFLFLYLSSCYSLDIECPLKT